MALEGNKIILKDDNKRDLIIPVDKNISFKVLKFSDNKIKINLSTQILFNS